MHPLAITGRLRSLGLTALVAVTCLTGTARSEDADSVQGPPEPVLIPGTLQTDPPLGRRLLIPPLLLEQRGDVRTRAVFPLYFERESPSDHQRLVLPYYWRRGQELNADVVGGLFWLLRGKERFTLALPPFYTHREGADRALGLAPFFFHGQEQEGARYTVVPPLLTFARRDGKSLQQFIGPLWRVHRRHLRWWGLFPLLWGKRSLSESAFVSPLFFRFTDEDGARRTSVLPPFYHMVRGEERGFGLLPLFAHRKGPKLSKTTIPLALFHHGREDGRLQLVLPGFAYLEKEGGNRLGVTPLFQWKRGPKSNANMVAPFFFQQWDERDQSRSLALAPFFFHFTDPGTDTLVVPPLWLSRERYGVSRTWWTPLAGHMQDLEKKSDTWWIAPTVQYSRSAESFAFNIHPLWYYGRKAHTWHVALAPLYFDFRDSEAKTHKRVAAGLYYDFRDGRKKTAQKVLFPVFWSFTKAERTRTVSLNTFYQKEKVAGGTKWLFHFFPLFDVGREPQGKSWHVLGGLAGYERRGEHRRLKMFWLPVQLGPARK